jgi:cytoskeletal protein CcmA (bactofilin family)
MSCQDELVRWLYVEGELSAQELRSFEGHLVACRTCRAAVLALREESDLLSDVLRERARPARVPVHTARARAPEPGVVIGLPATIAAVTAALTAVGFLIEASLPGGLVNPLHLMGAYEMAFDLVFLLRDRAPGLVELALSLGGVAAVSALLTFAAGALYRRVYGATALLLIAAAGAASGPAYGLQLRIDEETRVDSSEVIEESMLLTGDRVHVDGVIEGDLIASAERVTIRGTVEGSLYVLTRELEIEGSVEGSIHGAVESTRIDGEVRGSMYELGRSVVVGPGGRVGRDVSLLAERAVLDGEVGRDLVFAGDELDVDSKVGRNVQVHAAERIVLGKNADIAGDLEAGVKDEGDIERAEGARIGGELRLLPREDLGDLYRSAYRDPWVWLAHGLSLVAAFLFGLLLYALAPQLFAGELHTAPQFFRALGYGFLVAVATPVAIVLMALTVVGIPVAVLTLFVFVVAFYTSEIVVGAWIGTSLLPPADRSLYAFGRALFAGLAILTLAMHIPYLGPPVAIVAVLLGLGLILGRARVAVPLPS